MMEGIASNRKPFYRNNREELINEFCEDVKSIFGEIELKIKHDARGMVVFLPRLIGDILELVGCPVGRKVLLNPSPPKWIEKLDKKLIKEYIRVAMDDDGSVGDHHIVIGSSVDITALARKSFVKMLLKLPEMERIRTLKNIDKLKPEKFIPKILLFNKKLIEKFNIKTSQPVIERYYTDKQNKNLRVYWKFYISSKHNLEKFQKIIGFKIQDKFQKLEMNL